MWYHDNHYKLRRLENGEGYSQIVAEVERFNEYMRTKQLSVLTTGSAGVSAGGEM